MNLILLILGIICAVFCVIFIIAAVIEQEPEFVLPMLIFCVFAAICFYGVSVNGTYNCPQCNKEISSRANCCTYCGSILDAEDIATVNQSIEDFIVCKKCGKELCKEANFCDRCGEQVYVMCCNGCGKRIKSASEYAFCPDCGLDLRIAANISNTPNNTAEEK
ncbi:MAG: zinc ribbon domain-containing protein [Candidatus Gastranaerophilaceae bacterium]